MQIEDLGNDEGLEEFPESTLIALIDADTIAYAACVTNEFSEDISEDMYDEETWEQLMSDPNFDPTGQCLWYSDTESAISDAIAHITDIQVATDTKHVELYFSKGKSFRHTVDPNYKSNRKGTRYPAGLGEVKAKLLKQFSGCMCEGLEADDMVVFKKKTYPEQYILCAVDKDVLNSVPGKHYNYYRSEKWSIAPKWQDTSPEYSTMFPYLQVLMGDSADGIAGCPGIGPKKAMQALAKCTTEKEMWDSVVALYKKKGLKDKDAIRTMRLINMHQIDEEGNWCPWIPPVENS